MDFGDILDEWDKIKREREEERKESSGLPAPSAPAPSAPAPSAPAPGKPAPGKPGPAKPGRASPAKAALESWLDAKGVEDKDAESDQSRRAGAAERAQEGRRLGALKSQAVLDLHGLSAEEAESAVWAFIDSSARHGLEKVLVIHGKGIHSAGSPVLKKAARRVLEGHPLAGRFGEADRAEGGSGAMWVLIKRRER
jgi:DNA-nicking Smr family endonuclease